MCGLLKSNTLWAGFAAGPRRVLRAAAFFGASPVVASALDLHSGATPAENHYLSRGGKPLARSVTFLNDPTEPISVMLLNDLTGVIRQIVIRQIPNRHLSSNRGELVDSSQRGADL